MAENEFGPDHAYDVPLAVDELVKVIVGVPQVIVSPAAVISGGVVLPESVVVAVLIQPFVVEVTETVYTPAVPALGFWPAAVYAFGPAQL